MLATITVFEFPPNESVNKFGKFEKKKANFVLSSFQQQ